MRPVSRVERVGEHSAVVCHCEYIRPLSASRWSVGMLMPPPKGDHAAKPVDRIQSAVIEAVQDFRGKSPQEDDVTLVVVKLI